MIKSDGLAHVSGSNEITGELVSEQDKARHHDEYVRGIRAAVESAAAAPQVEGDQNERQGGKLTQLHAEIEGDHVRHQSRLRERKFLQLRRQTKTMGKT